MFKGIALCGEMRTGKDTVAAYLEEKYGFVPYAFGDRLKDGFHREYPHIPRNPKPVRGYQLYGQLQRYVVDENIWVDRCFKDIRHSAVVAEVCDKEFIPIITDMRQPNEFERCKAKGFVTIRVQAPVNLRVERMKQAGDEFKVENLTFETETHINTFPVDHVINNIGTLYELYEEVDFIMEVLLGLKKVTL